MPKGENPKVDVTLQTMNIVFPACNYAAGASIGMAGSSAEARFEVICMITAIEQTLAGDCYFAKQTEISNNHFGQKYIVPFEYSAGNHTAGLNRKHFRSNSSSYDTFEMYTYSIGK